MRALRLICLAGVPLVLLAAAHPATGSADVVKKLQRSALSIARVKAAPAAAPSLPRYANTCPVRALQSGVTVQEQLLASDCKLRDLIPELRSAAPVDQYRITISRRSVLTIREQSAEFDPTVYLLSDDAGLLALNNDAEGSTNSRIRISVQPGSYLILATAKDVSTGNYTLEAQVEDPRTCALTTAALNEDIPGQISNTGCRVLDLRNGTDESAVVPYRMQVARNSVATISMRSTDFDAALALYSSSDARIASSDNVRGGTDPEILMSLPAGTYTIYARVARMGSGAYTLRIKTEDPRPCAIANLAPNSSVTGELAASDCRVLDLLIGESDTTYIDVYRVRLEARSILTTTERSTDFDAAQWLLTEDLKLVELNDDESSSSTDSRLLTSLHRGSYLLLVNSVSSSTGAYQLQSRVEQPRDCPVQDLAAGTTVNGTLSTNACRAVDVITPSGDEEPAAVYRLTLDHRMRLTVDMTSTQLDAYLYLLDAAYEVLEIDDESGGLGNARIDLTVPAGTYYVVASSWEATPGSFSLTATTAEPKACTVQELALNAKFDGALDSSDCTLADFVAGAPAAPVDQFTIDVTQRGVLELVVTASSFPPVVLIGNSETGAIVGTDENLGMALTARVKASVAPGKYLVLLTTYERQGTYSLETTFTAQ